MAGNLEDLYVNPEEARSAAQRIDTAKNQMDEGIKNLSKRVDEFMDPSKTNTQWTTRFYEETWNPFYSQKYPDMINKLAGQVSNLNASAQAADVVNRG